MTIALSPIACPVFIMRVPHAGAAVDHVVAYPDVDALRDATASGDELSMCGERFHPSRGSAYDLCAHCDRVLRDLQRRIVEVARDE